MAGTTVENVEELVKLGSRPRNADHGTPASSSQVMQKQKMAGSEGIQGQSLNFTTPGVKSRVGDPPTSEAKDPSPEAIPETPGIPIADAELARLDLYMEAFKTEQDIRFRTVVAMFQASQDSMTVVEKQVVELSEGASISLVKVAELIARLDEKEETLSNLKSELMVSHDLTTALRNDLEVAKSKLKTMEEMEGGAWTTS
eukprot:gene30331-35326_t